MARYFEGPSDDDDGAIEIIHFNKILPAHHPARFIKMFVDNLDISEFESKYQVGEGQKGRAPKKIRLMLGVILYGIYSRIYSARKIDLATYSYADFWLFSHKKRVSHDKISDFIIMHEKEMKAVFLETILLAEKNQLLDFNALYMDGFQIKANASKHKSRNKRELSRKQEKLEKALDEVMQKLGNPDKTDEVEEEKERLACELAKVKVLQQELNEKIRIRTENKEPQEAKVIEEKLSINATDKDSEMSKMKDGSYANAYTKINALDAKADIVIGSDVDGRNDEPGKTLDLFRKSQDNCKDLGEYKTAVADSNFNTMGNCVQFESQGIEFISPTRDFENEKRNPEKYKNKIRFEYKSEQNCVICSEGKELTEGKRYLQLREGRVIMTFWNKTACRSCPRVKECTQSQFGYKKVKLDARIESQQKVLEKYKSDAGKEIYKKRQHTAEVYQADCKYNGKMSEFLRRGLDKVRVDSLIYDTIWNLRRIFNVKAQNVVWAK
jgi:transposase